MAQPLQPYTRTYSDVEGETMDADDLRNEFLRVAEFMELWGAAIEASSESVTATVYVTEVTGEVAEIIPERGLIQRLEVAGDVDHFDIIFTPHTTGAPYRTYVSIRCRSADTTFSITGLNQETHLFGVNREVYGVSQTEVDGFFSATLILTMSRGTGVLAQIHARNPEEDQVDYNDILQLRAV